MNKILIFTNLSWLRNPYANPLKLRPNPRRYGDTIMDIRKIQTRRELTDEEVLSINYIIKKRAYKYIAAPYEDWLYPEKYLQDVRWDNFGKNYLLMPDPRELFYSSELVIRYSTGHVQGVDAYGRSNMHPNYNTEQGNQRERETFEKFKEEFERKFGLERRGKAWR